MPPIHLAPYLGQMYRIPADFKDLRMEAFGGSVINPYVVKGVARIQPQLVNRYFRSKHSVGLNSPDLVISGEVPE